MSFILTTKQDESPNEFVSWDALVTLTEQLLAKYPTPSQAVKDVITSTFDELLARFPLFFGYWKKYTSLQYQINGLEESIKVLSRSLDAFPTSLELWIDYLTILSSHSQDEHLLRLQFETALTNVGSQFLSHTLWDKYIEWEQGRKNSLGVIKILTRVIHLPLHQYARYYQSFTTMKETISVEQLIELDDSLTVPESADVASFVTEHYNSVFLKTQEFVGAVWPFESQIKQSYFNISPPSEEEVENWENYLDLLILRHASSPSILNKTQTVSTFERALIPTASSHKFWYKYLQWYTNNYPTEFEALDSIYKRATDVFLPISYTDLRLQYALFLESHNQEYNKVEDVFLSVIRSKYEKNQYNPVTQYIKFVSRKKKSPVDIAKWLDSVVSEWFNKRTDAQDITIRRFVEVLNLRTINIPIVELVKINWYHLKNHSNVKKYLFDFSQREELAGSAPFWSLNYKYTKKQKNMGELERIVAFIKDKSSLPITIISAILLDYADFISHQRPSSLSSQTAYKNVLLLEHEAAHPLTSRMDNDEELRKRQRQQSGHAAVFISKPRFTNSTIDTVVSRSEPAPLPSFRNVERANAKIVYAENE